MKRPRVEWRRKIGGVSFDFVNEEVRLNRLGVDGASMSPSTYVIDGEQNAVP
jgi:hypothetical protein